MSKRNWAEVAQSIANRCPKGPMGNEWDLIGGIANESLVVVPKGTTKSLSDDERRSLAESCQDLTAVFGYFPTDFGPCREMSIDEFVGGLRAIAEKVGYTLV
jgi:hypothetical protein